MIVYTYIADIEDDEIPPMAGFHYWLRTEVGMWAKEHALRGLELMFDKDPAIWAHRVTIIAQFTPVDETYFKLRWM